MMSFVPFFLLIVSAFGYFLGENKEFYEFLVMRLVGFFPKATREISDEIGKIITFRGVGVVTLGIYLYFSYQLYYALERPVNIMFGSQERRPQFISLFLSLFGVALVILFIAVSFGAASLVPLLDYLARFITVPKLGEMTRILIQFIVPVLLSFMIATALYMLLPQKKIRPMHAACGGLFAGIMFEVAKIAFTWYAVVKLAQLGNIYGPLTTVVILLLWIFYAACIFLIGAELVRNLAMEDQKQSGNVGEDQDAVN